MNINEKNAIVDYLEFLLIGFVEQAEQHLDPDAIPIMYEHAYVILNDIERTLETQVLLDYPTHPNNSSSNHDNNS